MCIPNEPNEKAHWMFEIRNRMVYKVQKFSWFKYVFLFLFCQTRDIVGRVLTQFRNNVYSEPYLTTQINLRDDMCCHIFSALVRLLLCHILGIYGWKYLNQILIQIYLYGMGIDA